MHPTVLYATQASTRNKLDLLENFRSKEKVPGVVSSKFGVLYSNFYRQELTITVLTSLHGSTAVIVIRGEMQPNQVASKISSDCLWVSRDCSSRSAKNLCYPMTAELTPLPCATP